MLSSYYGIHFHMLMMLIFAAFAYCLPLITMRDARFFFFISDYRCCFLLLR